MGRPRIHDETTTARLTDAAERLLAEGGVAALSVRAVADLAGSTTRAVYSVFGSKEEMVRALFRRGVQAFLATSHAAPEHDDPFENLMSLTRNGFRAFAVGQPHLYRLIFEQPLPGFAPSPDDLSLLRAALEVLQARMARVVAAGLGGGRDAGRLSLEWTLAVQGIVSADLNARPAEAREEAIVNDLLGALFAGWSARPIGAQPVRAEPVRSGPGTR